MIVYMLIAAGIAMFLAGLLAGYLIWGRRKSAGAFDLA